MDQNYALLVSGPLDGEHTLYVWDLSTGEKVESKTIMDAEIEDFVDDIERRFGVGAVRIS